MNAKPFARPRLWAVTLTLLAWAAGIPANGQTLLFGPQTSVTGPGFLQGVATNNSTESSSVWITNVSVIPSSGLATILFTIAGGSNGAAYDVFLASALTSPLSNETWHWMGQGYPGVTYATPVPAGKESFLILGTPQDSDGDGLTDAYELLVSHSDPYVANSINPAMPDEWSVLYNLDPFTLYNQQSNPTAPQLRLGYWQFNATNYAGQAGQLPIASQDDPLVPDWSGNAVSLNSVDSSSELLYNVFETNGLTNLDCANGTVRFWFQPNWSTGGANAPTNGCYFICTGFTAAGSWSLSLNNNGSNYGGLFVFGASSNQFQQTITFKTGAANGAPVYFQSNLWYQIALTYSPSNVALYTNGALLATGNWPPGTGYGQYEIFSNRVGVVYYPASNYLTGGFAFGGLPGQPCSVRGQLDELETFNYPLTPQAVASGFPTFGGSSYNVMTDSDYDGRSDLLEILVDGKDPNDPASVAQCRMGYWRFDSDTLMAEQGQLPLSYYDVSLTPSWSGTALNINTDPASEVTYWDVFTNGWANVNCRQGSLRFWFKPNWNTPPAAPLFYLGNTNSSVSQWSLNVNPDGALTFVTASNSITITNITSPSLPFNPGHWIQIVLNYGPKGSSLYANGALAATGSPVSIWPTLLDRNRGMVIGNNTAYNQPVNAQFDEIETFNYQLAASNILANFQAVNAVDSDLDGIPDLLEDIVLAASRPYLGSPVVIAGTIEAEQFDMGGPGVAYSNVAPNPASSYRPTGMFITNCDDLGLGYCLDQTRAGEWAQYTINVLTAQNYTIETRAAGIGLNGVFECEFTNDGFYTNTGPLTITSTNWTNIVAVVGLPAGIYTMKLHFLTNGTDGTHVGRFNYISIYPWWKAGFATTNLFTIQPNQLSTNNDWRDAVNNAAVVQSNVNLAESFGGGTISLPAGTYFISQTNPSDTNPAWQNAAVSILGNNVEIEGAGKSNTTLVAFSRATTAFCLGVQTNGFQVQCANFMLHDLTLQAQPHRAVRNGTNTIFEYGQLVPNGYTGAMTMLSGANLQNFTSNILISNCQFLFPDVGIIIPGYVSNMLVCQCDFKVWGGTNIYSGAIDNYPTNTIHSAVYNGSVGIFGTATPQYNLTIVNNTYNGNTNLVPSTNNPFGYVNSMNVQLVAPDGFVWLQGGGNFFIGRNSISNYALEALQLNAGPNVVVGNSYGTLVNDASCCAVAAFSGGASGLTAFNVTNNTTCFIGNQIYGGRNGESSQGSAPGRPYSITISGNEFSLFPPFSQAPDYPGSVINVANCSTANITGNTLLYGGLGAEFGPNCGSALIVNNNFSGAAYMGVGFTGGGGTLQTARIFNNVISEGVDFHVELPFATSFGWFLGGNEYLGPSGESVPPFLDPAASAVHEFY